ncbi:TRAP transporter small permease [Ruminococcaceae bacterium OttesenSCG-928-I18]|nr:TRAP transporter small permease [Ruminococcaceae bacterium OttesenSCG-928-I18]
MNEKQVNENPKEETPLEETPVEEAPVEETPAEGPAAEATPPIDNSTIDGPSHEQGPIKKNWLYYYNQVEEKFLIISFAITVILIFVQVVMRSVFNSSLSWSEELARYMFVWQCWIAVSLAERYGQHIRISMMINKVPRVGRMVIEYLVIAMTVAVCVYFVITGVQLVAFLVNSGTVSTVLKIPMSVVYAAMPIGCFLYATRLVMRAGRLITGKEVLE